MPLKWVVERKWPSGDRLVRSSTTIHTATYTSMFLFPDGNNRLGAERTVQGMSRSTAVVDVARGLGRIAPLGNQSAIWEASKVAA